MCFHAKRPRNSQTHTKLAVSNFQAVNVGCHVWGNKQRRTTSRFRRHNLRLYFLSKIILFSELLPKLELRRSPLGNEGVSGGVETLKNTKRLVDRCDHSYIQEKRL